MSWSDKNWLSDRNSSSFLYFNNKDPKIKNCILKYALLLHFGFRSVSGLILLQSFVSMFLVILFCHFILLLRIKIKLFYSLFKNCNGYMYTFLCAPIVWSFVKTDISYPRILSSFLKLNTLVFFNVLYSHS